MTFGEKITDLRKKNGFTQEELAEKLNITRQTISKWELDQSTPDLEYIGKLSEIFGVSTDYLIKENINPGNGYQPFMNGVFYEPPKQSKPSASMGTAKVFGLVLMIIGAIMLPLSLITYAILSVTGVVFFPVCICAVLFLICGVVLFVCKKHPIIVCLWILIAILAVPVVIFQLKMGGMLTYNMGSIVTIVWCVGFVAVLIATITNLRKSKKQDI